MSDRHSRLNRTGHWIYDDAREVGRDAQLHADLVEAIAAQDHAEAHRLITDHTMTSTGAGAL